MSDLFWQTEAQLERLRPFFPKPRGVPRVDDRRVLGGMIFINRNGLRRRDAPAEYSPRKTLHSRWKRLSGMGVFDHMPEGLAEGSGYGGTLMIDAAHLKVRRPAASRRLKKGIRTADRTGRGRTEFQAPHSDRRPWKAAVDAPDRWPRL